MIPPIAQIKKILDEVNEKLNEFTIALLTANGNSIILRDEILLEDTNSYRDDNDSSITYCPFFIEEIIYKDGKVLVCQSHNGQAVEFDNRFNIIEKEHILTKAAFAAKNPAKTEFWIITSVAREDVKSAGYETEDIGNEEMERLSRKMSDAYVSNGFWEDLKIIAEELGFHKKEKKRYNMGWSQANNKYMIVYAECLEKAEELFESGEYKLEKEE